MINKRQVLLGIYIFLYSVMMAQTEDWNLDFEKWNDSLTSPQLTDTIVENREGIFPLNWFSNPDFIPEGKGIGRTTDGTNEEFAVVLSGFYQYQIMKIFSGISPNKPGWPINYRPSMLKGNYKSILLGTSCDSLRAYVDVYLTKYRVNTSTRDTIGEGHLILHETENYQNFEMNIEYSDLQIIPDSVTIVLTKERFGFPFNINECYECSHVYFDNLELVKSTVSINDVIEDDKFKCYPNPFNNQLYIKNESNKDITTRFFDSKGTEFYQLKLSTNSTAIIPEEKINSNIIFVSDGTSIYKVLKLH